MATPNSDQVGMDSKRASVKIEKRSHARAPIDLPVWCEWNSDERTAGRARDLGFGGMFIEAAEQPAFGTLLTVVLSLPGSGAEQRLPAIVRWAKSDGFGVQFGLLDARTTYAISRLLR